MVSKVLSVEDFRLFGFLERAVDASDVSDVVFGEFFALFTQGFTHPLEMLGGVDQLHLVLAATFLLI